MLSSTVMHTTSLSYNSQTKKQPPDVEVSTGASLSDTLPEKKWIVDTILPSKRPL